MRADHPSRQAAGPHGGGRVLMLAHHFPPMGGSGANRALAFARYLPMYGWRPTVITPRAEYAINRDDRLLDEIPAHVRIVRTRSLEALPRRNSDPAPPPQTDPARQRAWRQQLGHLRRFPDAHVGWLPYALAAACRQPYDVAYSSSGPFTTHLTALLLKRLTGKPWVAELRDGWYRWNRAIFPDYPAWRDALERRLEAAALRSADRVVLVTQRMAEAFRQQYPDLPNEQFAVVPNGYDPAQYAHDEMDGLAEAHEGWRLLHVGALYYGRSVSTLLQAAQSVIEADPAFRRDFRLRLIGTLDGVARAEVERSAVRVELVPQTSHEQAIREMRAADALLLVANTTFGADATVPGKLFEYLAVGRPVLAVAPCASSTVDVLGETGGGWLAAADDVGDIARALRQAYAERTARINRAGVARYDRRRLAGNLATILDEVTCRRL